MEDQVRRLESYKERLEKSLTKSTMIVLTIVVYIQIFSCLYVITAGDAGNDRILPLLFIIAIILTMITALKVRDNSKRKDKEVLERTNKEIEDLKNKIQSIK